MSRYTVLVIIMLTNAQPPQTYYTNEIDTEVSCVKKHTRYPTYSKNKTINPYQESISIKEIYK